MLSPNNSLPSVFFVSLWYIWVTGLNHRDTKDTEKQGRCPSRTSACQGPWSDRWLVSVFHIRAIPSPVNQARVVAGALAPEV